MTYHYSAKHNVDGRFPLADPAVPVSVERAMPDPYIRVKLNEQYILVVEVTVATGGFVSSLCYFIWCICYKCAHFLSAVFIVVFSCCSLIT